MSELMALVRNGRRIEAHRPWTRTVVDRETWRRVVARLAEDGWTMLGLWGEDRAVHLAVLDEAASKIAVVSLDCPEGRFPSVGRTHPPAIRPERAIRDLYGLEPEGAQDARPWLDHGRWAVHHPLGPAVPTGTVAPYRFLPAEGEGLHEVAVGPVHAGIIEPGHFRFTVNGETVVRLEPRLGYVHKGIEGLMTGADLDRGAKLAGRTSGDSTVAYGLAFARAVEAALGIEAPSRAHWLRALMAEIERLANHLGDIGAVCNDASFALMHAHCSVLRERVLRAADGAFGHRLMMDRIVPGGVTVDPDRGAFADLRALVVEIRRRFPALVELYDGTTSLQDRTVGAGMLAPALARRFGAGGFVGRASGRAFDARRMPGYPPYDALSPEVQVRSDGDVNARVWIRIREVEQSLALMDRLLDPPEGPVRTEVPCRAGEGLALVEGFRGDILAWVRIHGSGRVARCHLRDPSWFQWPALEAAVEGNIVADFPLCNKSFNCAYSGHDL